MLQSEDLNMSLVSDSAISEKSEEIKTKSCDRNNNTHSTFRGKRLLSKTYGLRPRSSLRRLLIDSDICDFKPPILCKSNRGDKHAPLSKYRRKTANARERHRMKEINDAFSTLRRVLPPIHTRRTVMSSMTKITTLRLAVAYIRALSEILDENCNATPSETTRTLLTAANLQIWNENIAHEQSSPSNSIVEKSYNESVPNNCPQSFPKTEEISTTDHVNIETLLNQTFNEEALAFKRPCREQGFLPEKSSIAMNNYNINDCDLDDNTSFWDDIPLLNDFQWTLT